MLFGKARRERDERLADVTAVLAAVHRSRASIEFRLDGVITAANPNFLAVMGFEAQDVVGRHHRMFVEPSYAASPDYKEFWDRLARGEFFSDKFRRFGKGGREVWIQATYNPVLDAQGRPYKVVKFATDVTEAERERERTHAAQAEQVQLQQHAISELGAGLSRLAAGDLRSHAIAPFGADYEPLRADLMAAVASLRAAMAEVSVKTSALDTATAEITTAADDLSRRTEHQAATLEETAAALDEITATVRTTADGSQRARSSAEAAGLAAARSDQVVERAVAAMGRIETSSREISQIVSVIDEIAFQTNLLALNAGVEAARAGDAGRGFAVVASEVRSLAQRSASAAKEIKVLINTSETQVREGVQMVGAAGEALTLIAGQVTDINTVVGEIAASCREQAHALAEVNTAINQMDQTTQQNAAMVEETTAAAKSLGVETSELSRLVARFELHGDHSSSSPHASADEEACGSVVTLRRRGMPHTEVLKQALRLPRQASLR